ncbi:hypothetical protein VTG60DRAFT_3432 [Thermothelomyces hinnuleus]
MSLGTVAASVLDFAQRQADRIMPPASREDAYAKTKEFATARPMLFSFILAQAVFSAFPILCFLAFVFSVLSVLSTGFLFATLFWIGIALLVLIPILVLTSGAALFTWAFGAASFIFGQWIYTVLRDTAANFNEELGNHQQDKEPARPRLAPPAGPSSSSSATSWARVERQPTNQGGELEAQQKESAHPDPGSDVDALEP